LLGKLLKGRSTKANRGNMQYRLKVIQAQQQARSEKEEEEEMKFRRMLKERLRNSMIEEQRITEFNRTKIMTEWRKIMRMAKTDELQREIEIYSQNYEREVDAKDAMLQMLDRDLEEAEEQYQTALRNHFIHVDRLLALQSRRLEGLEEEFKTDLAVLVEEFERERTEIVENHRLEKKELLDIIMAVEEEEKKKEEKAKSTYESYREETKNKNSEDLVLMQTQLGLKTEAVDREFELHYTNYDQSTKETTQHYNTQFEKNKKLSKDLEAKHRKLEHLNEQIALTKYKTRQIQKEMNAKNEALKREKDNVLRHYTELKKKMLQFRDSEVKRLTELISNSRACEASLREQVEMGENILKLAELCRKLETEKEKVLPFYAVDPEAAATEQQLLEQEKAYLEDFQNTHASEVLRFLNAEEVFDEYAALENFYKRLNKVMLDKLAIEKQKKQLEKENLFFKNLLKQYLDGVSVNEDVMSAPNPLLVVNHKINLSRQPVERTEPLPVVEAAFVMQTRLRQ